MGGGDVARSRETLSHLIELSGLSRREVEKRLLEQGCGTDLGRLLSGKLDLKLRHIVDICRVIDVFPLEVFQIVWKESERRSPLLRRLEALVAGGHPRAAPPAPKLDDLLCRLSELLHQLEISTTDPTMRKAKLVASAAAGDAETWK